MIARFKLYGQRYALDTASGAIHPLTEIQFDMLRYLCLPFEEAFPSVLRYDLAKYESSQLAEAYMALRSLWLDGVFGSDVPLTVEDTALPEGKKAETVSFDGKKFVFASEIIKKADGGIPVLDAVEDKQCPVKESDYDILIAEYERIAKEIIKRKTGRIPGQVFEFASFRLPLVKDRKGYTHLASRELVRLFESEEPNPKRTIIECGIAVSLVNS